MKKWKRKYKSANSIIVGGKGKGEELVLVRLSNSEYEKLRALNDTSFTLRIPSQTATYKDICYSKALFEEYQEALSNL